ncbi:MAG: hypothetical protein ABSH20_06265 [Tepidisphaeraceae bacterium]
MAPLDYETPATRGKNARIIEMLRYGEGFGWTGVGLRLLCGIGLTIFSSTTLGGIVTFIICRFVLSDYAGLIYCASVLAVGYWSFRRARSGGDNPMMDEMRGYGPGPAQSMGEFDTRGITAYVWVWWDILISGPKLILEAVASWRGRDKAPDIDLERTADTVVDLYRAGQGVRVAELLHPGDSMEGMGKILAYLEWQDWIGFSKDRDRVWLSSRLVPKIREALQPRTPGV